MGTILIVDENPLDRMSLAGDLERKKHEVSEACPTKQSALWELVGEKSFDVAIVKRRMPVMNGMEFVKGLRNRGKDLPVILTTEKFSPEMIDEVGRQEGVTAVVSNQVMSAALIAAIDTVLGL
jgi:CheY-like chemotaxis protein